MRRGRRARGTPRRATPRGVASARCGRARARASRPRPLAIAAVAEALTRFADLVDRALELRPRSSSAILPRRLTTLARRRPPPRSAPRSAGSGRRTRPSPAPARRISARVRAAHQLVHHRASFESRRPAPCGARSRSLRSAGLQRIYTRLCTIVCRNCAKTCARRSACAARVRVLVVTNMYPTPERPALGPFVRDQVEALRRRDDLEVELFAFGPGPRALVARGARAAAALSRAALRHRPRPLRADRVAGAARAARAGGRDAARQRPARPPLVLRDARGAAVHRAGRRGLARVQREPARRGDVRGGSRSCRSGSTCERFRPIPRAEARARLGLDPDGPYLLFPHDPVAAAEALRPRASRRRATCRC